MTEQSMDYISSDLRDKAIPLSEVKLDPDNVRQHGDRNLEAIKESLRAFGQQRPIIVDKDGVVRAGNATLRCAKALGWKYIAVTKTELTGAEAKAFAIADNRAGDLDTGSVWDPDKLHAQIEEIAQDFDNADINKMFSEIEYDWIQKKGNKYKEKGGGGGGDDESLDPDDPGTEGAGLALLPHEHYDYVIVLATNVYEWASLCEKLGIKPIRYGKGQMKKVGFGRAITAKSLLEKLEPDDDTDD